MALSLEQLRAFVETVKGGSFRAAALSLGKHSSTVGELVGNLEIDLGLELFERSRRGITLTDAGAELYDYAAPAIREAELFQDKADSLLDQQPSRLSVGIDPGLRCPELSTCLKAVLERYPTINLNVQSGDVMQLYSWLRSGQIDVALAPTSISGAPDIHYNRSFAFSLCGVIARDYPVKNGSLPASELRGLTQIAHSFMLSSGHAEAHVLSNHVIKANNSHEIIELVATGIGWALMPMFIAEAHVESGRIHRFVIDQSKPDLWFSEVLHLASATVNPAMKLFIEQAKQIPDKLST